MQPKNNRNEIGHDSYRFHFYHTEPVFAEEAIAKTVPGNRKSCDNIMSLTKFCQ
jgi:hypothetical protein